MPVLDRTSPSLSRRGFLGGAVGLTFAFTLTGLLSGRPQAVLAAAGAQERTLGAWVTIRPDGGVVIAAPAAEMGQGVFTALPMILAEEMDADWQKVEPIFAPAVPEKYGNPGFGGGMITVGSRAVSGYWTPLRLQGAAVRRFLMQSAADEWGVSIGEVSTEPGAVVHSASGRRITYGEIAGTVEPPEALPEIGEADLKDPADFRIIGQNVPRFDLPLKVDGSARYGIDAAVPGMVYATVLRAPVAGAEIGSVNRAEIEGWDGILQVVELPHTVAVVGETVEAVFAARQALVVEWQGGATRDYASEPALEDFARRAAAVEEEAGLSYFNRGDVRGVKATGARTIAGDYMSDYVYHAQMEPMNLTASVGEDSKSAEIWVGTQSPSGVLGAAAATLETEPGNITIHQHWLGGGFGRRAAIESIPEALLIAKAVGRPVKVIWTREQDVKSAVMRPQTAHHLEAVLDDTGEVVGWHHRIVAEATTAYASPARLEAAQGLDPLTLEGATHQYAIPNQLIDYLRHVNGTPLQAWRAIGAGYNKFAIEAFVDELAHEVGADPVEFRLKLLSEEPRARAVVEVVAEMAGWGRPASEGRGFGFTYAQVVGSYTASVAEVSVDGESGQIRVHNFWNAVDPGIVVHPDTVRNQLESNIVWGLSQAVKERMTLVDGVVQQNNYTDYEILRMSETPDIHTRVISTNNPPSGIGEVSLPLVGGAVSNAVFALTGQRLRHMPFTPDRVKATLVQAA